LQPSLALGYNSQAVDGANGLTQASWVGLGWAFETGYVLRSQNGTPNVLEDDTFTLNLNGASHLLLQDESGIYHTADESFLRIEHVDNLWHDDRDVSYWVVWSKTGEKYYFGNIDPEAEYSNRATYETWEDCTTPTTMEIGTPTSNAQPTPSPTARWRWCSSA
jgi:hypothetical protein